MALEYDRSQILLCAPQKPTNYNHSFPVADVPKAEVVLGATGCWGSAVGSFQGGCVHWLDGWTVALAGGATLSICFFAVRYTAHPRFIQLSV